MKSWLQLFVLGIATWSFAQSVQALPYYGPSLKKPCQVNRPDSKKYRDIDAGYLTNEDCTTIYVKPPLVGSMVMNAPNFMFPEQRGDCEAMDAGLKYLQRWYERELRDRHQNPAAINREYNNQLTDIVNYGSNDAYSRITGQISLQWSNLVQAYRDANVGSHKTVKQLPILIGVLTGTEDGVAGYGSMVNITDLVDATKTSIVSQKFFGLQLPNDLISSDRFPIPPELENYGGHDDPIIMGQSLAFELELNRSGTCALLNGETRLAQDPMGDFAATYTYFYPLQTDALLSVTYNSSHLQKKLAAILKEYNGHIDVAELQAAFKKSDPITINLNPGLFKADPNFEHEYLSTMEHYVLDGMLSSISNEVDLAVDGAKYNTQQTLNDRTCHHSFGIGPIFCHNHYYTVNTQHIDWAKVDKFLASYALSSSGEVKQFHNLVWYDTTTFRPKILRDTSIKSFENLRGYKSLAIKRGGLK